MKRIRFLFLMLILLLPVPYSSFASIDESHNSSVIELEDAYTKADQTATKNAVETGYGYGRERIGNSDSFITVTIKKTAQDQGTQSDFITGNDYVEYTKTAGAKNIFGKTNWEIELVGGFTYTGKEVKAATSSVTTECGWFWESSDEKEGTTNIGPTLAQASGSAHFSLKFGVDPVSVPVRDFTESVRILCDEDGLLVDK